MNCVRKFILLIVVIFGSGSDLCHVFGSNIKDNISDNFGFMRARRFSREFSFCPVKHLFGCVMGHSVVNSNRYKLELLTTRRTRGIWMGLVMVYGTSTTVVV